MNETVLDPESLAAVQIGLFDQITKALVNHKKTGDARRTKIYFAARIESIQTMRTEFKQRHCQVVASDLELENDYFKNDVADQFEEKYLEAFSYIQEDFLKKFPPPAAETPDLNGSVFNSSASSAQPATTFTRFSSLPVPEFSGKYTDWPTFYDSFLRIVHQNASIQTIEKFHLLKQALKTTADSDIRDLPLTDANYAEAWKSVIERYHQGRVLFTHFMNLFSSQPTITRENVGARN